MPSFWFSALRCVLIIPSYVFSHRPTFFPASCTLISLIPMYAQASPVFFSHCACRTNPVFPAPPVVVQARKIPVTASSSIAISESPLSMLASGHRGRWLLSIAGTPQQSDCSLPSESKLAPQPRMRMGTKVALGCNTTVLLYSMM